MALLCVNNILVATAVKLLPPAATAADTSAVVREKVNAAFSS